MVRIAERKIEVIEPVKLVLEDNVTEEFIKLFKKRSTKYAFNALQNKLELEGNYDFGKNRKRLVKEWEVNLGKDVITSISISRQPYQLIKPTDFTAGDLKKIDLIENAVGLYKIMDKNGNEIYNIHDGPGRNLLDLVVGLHTPIDGKINKRKIKKEAEKIIEKEGFTLVDCYTIIEKDKTPVNLVLNQNVMVQYSDKDFNLFLGLNPKLSYFKLCEEFFIRQHFNKEYEQIRKYMLGLSKIKDQKELIITFNRAYKELSLFFHLDDIKSDF